MLSLPSENMRQPLPNDPNFYTLSPRLFDIREGFCLVGLLIFFSPLGLNFLAFRACMTILVGSYALPFIIRLRYPRFMHTNITNDLGIYSGGSMFCIGFIAALQLQLHNASGSFAAKLFPKFYTQPLICLTNLCLSMEMMLNGSSEEKEQTASWLWLIHQDIDCSITDEMHGELGIPDDVEKTGDVNELKAHIIHALIWATIAFQTRFGRPLSKRAKDAVVLEFTYVGLRIGVPIELKGYDSFLVSFDHRLDILDADCSLTLSNIENAEVSLLRAKKNWITGILIRVMIMIGFDLLPQRLREKYRPKVLNTSWKLAMQRVLIAVVWLIYPTLMWLPLRGVICLFLVLESQLRTSFITAMKAIHSIDIHSEKPIYKKDNPLSKMSNNDMAHDELLSYLHWLESGKDSRPFFQLFFVYILEAQLRSAQAESLSRLSLGRITPWIRVPLRLALLGLDSTRRSMLETISCWRNQMKESIIFNDNESKMPHHVGIILDGNRRFARRLGKPAIFGHQRGTHTTLRLFEWWLRYLPNTVTSTCARPGPRYLTLWTFSIGNMKRSNEELKCLFRLMTCEFKSLALTSIVHLFQIRFRVIGNREGLPRELMDSIELLEESTRMYSRLFVQFAVGYGGRDEVVRSVKHVLARGGEITEDAISEGTFCAQAGVPPVDIIVRTSERRTSGFLLWDTQTAELHFVDKLWPEFTEGDWLDTLASFATREIRGGR